MELWRTQGGKSRLDQANTVNTNTIVADKFILRDYFYGDLLVKGDIKTPQSIIANANVVANMVATENVLASASIRAQQDITANNDLFVNRDFYLQTYCVHGTTRQGQGNVLTIVKNDDKGNYFHSQATLEELRTGNISTFKAGSFGFNSATPRATLDVFGTLPETMHLHADVPTTYSVLASNKTDVGVLSYADTGTAAVQFYQAIPVPNNNDKKQLPASFAPDAAVTYEVDSKALVLQSTNGGIRFVTDQGITFASTSGEAIHDTPLSKKDALVVYDVSDGLTFWPTVFDPSFSLTGRVNTGRGISVVGTQDQTSLSLSLATNTKQSFVHSFGEYPPQRAQSHYAVTYHDANGSLFPSWSMLSQDEEPTMRTRHAFNNVAPSTDEYAVEINGPLLLRSGEVHVTLDASFVVLGYAANALRPQNGFVFGEPYTTLATAVPKPADGDIPASLKPHVQSVVSTQSAGIKWTPYPFDSSNIDLGVEYTPFTAGAVLDASLQLVVSSDVTDTVGTFTYCSVDGGRTWAGLASPLTNVHHSVCAVRYDALGAIMSTASATATAARYQLLFGTPRQIGYTNHPVTLSDLASAAYEYEVMELHSATSTRTSIQTVVFPGRSLFYVVYNTNIVDLYDAADMGWLASVDVANVGLVSLSLLDAEHGYLCAADGSVFKLEYHGENEMLTSVTEPSRNDALKSLLDEQVAYALKSFVYQPHVNPDLTLVVLAHRNPLERRDRLFYACDNISPLTFREIDIELVLQAGGPSSWGHGTIADVTVINGTDIQVIQVLEPRNYDGNQAGRSRVVHLSFPALFSKTARKSLDVANGHVVVEKGHVSARNGFMRPANADSTHDAADMTLSALQVVTSLTPKTFAWSADGKEDVGFLYEDVVGIVPQAVDKQTKTVDYTKLIPYLWKAVKELSAL